MSLTVKDFTDKILEKYSRALLISLTVHQAEMNQKFCTWQARVRSIEVHTFSGLHRFDKQDYLDLFGDNYVIKFGVNNNRRHICRNSLITVHINPNLKSFINDEGKIIYYYPTTTLY